MRLRKRWRSVLLGIGLCWLTAAFALDLYGRREPIYGGWDAIVVAGCRVMPDGQPSHALEARTARAVELWRRGLAPRIIFTGGVGEFPPAEAIAAANVALQMGVPSEALWLEDRSTSTEENARHAAAILGGGRVLVVSDAYHIFRCERVFARYFEEVHGAGAISPISARLRGALREVMAVSWHGLRGRL